MTKSRLRMQLAVTALAAVVLVATVPDVGARECYRFAHDLPDSGVKPPVNTAPVCKVMLKNFNEYCKEPPMVCGLKVHPKYAELLKQPSWKRISPTPSIGQVENFIKAPELNAGHSASADQKWSFWKPKIEKSIRNGTLTIDEAKIDLFNQGRAEHAWRISTGECTPENHATPKSDYILMYQTTGFHVNLTTKAYQRHAGRESVSGAIHIFSFKGLTYDYGMRLDSLIIDRFEYSKDKQIVANQKNVCIIQLKTPEEK